MHALCLLRPLASALVLTGMIASSSYPFTFASPLPSFDSRSGQTAPDLVALDREVHADMAFLADDDLRGRGSATPDEHLTALFAASRFASLGLTPAGDNGSYLQRVPLPTPLPANVQRHLAPFETTPRTQTWNAIAILRGTAATMQPEEVILLTAHLDHLGVAKPTSSNPTADLIYNGADDDASGTAVVLALAHALASGPPLRRTIVFALFGSEELGGFGNAGFLAHPPVPLSSIIANLEFEMIGRPDAAARLTSTSGIAQRDALWLTGFDRSNLGHELARQGAPLAPDPHPSEDFFTRSDNYALAKQGIVAQTVSSFSLHKDYHQPSDSLATIDFPHLTHAIAAMTGPIQWLANSTFRPAWNPNRKP